MSNFPGASYDAWKLRAPEDEPGYWDNQTPECGDHCYNDKCDDCGKRTSVCAACHLCSKCHYEVDEAEARADEHDNFHDD